MSQFYSAGLFGPAIPDSGVSHLTFDDEDTSGLTATDVWGGYNGEIIGALSGSSGIAEYDSGEAYSFDGSGDHVLIQNFPWPANSMSISFWHELDNTKVNNVLFETETTDPRLTIRVDTTNGYDVFSNTGTTNNGSVSTGVRRFVTVVADATNSKLVCYIDGSELFSSSGFTAYSSGIIDLKIGSYYGHSSENNHYGGIIDDIRFYDKPLTASEVSNLYNSGSING